MGLVPFKKRHQKDFSLPSSPTLCMNEIMCAHSENVAVYNKKGEFLLETDHDGTLILDFQALELWKSKFLLFKLPVYGVLLWQAKQTKILIPSLYSKFVNCSNKVLHGSFIFLSSGSNVGSNIIFSCHVALIFICNLSSDSLTLMALTFLKSTDQLL